MTYQIHVNLKERAYPIYLGEGVLGQLGELFQESKLGRRLVIITNRTVARHYAVAMTENLKGSGFEPEVLTVPDGEKHKSLATAARLYDSLARLRADRGTPVVALGGGVIGDLTGFVAATWQRGVPFVQVPTTLLAQVDSSIGGKVAVNNGKLKNMVGTFYQPKLVAADTATLRTLPVREIRNGLAEVIKSAVIRDPELFEFLENNMPVLLDGDIRALTFAVHRAAEVKIGVVEQDEYDHGIRHILNFGHTFGHAVETVSGFKVAHGTAVAVGMASASRLAWKLGLLSGADLERILGLITAAGLPISLNRRNAVGAVVQAMSHDKKAADGRIKFILPAGIGTTVNRADIPTAMIAEVLSR
jgi:3-dehydroquinate synthase